MDEFSGRLPCVGVVRGGDMNSNPSHTEYGASRRQRSSTTVRREVWDEMNDAMRQKTPPSATVFQMFHEKRR